MDGELSKEMFAASKSFWFHQDLIASADEALHHLHLLPSSHPLISRGKKYIAFHWRSAEFCELHRKEDSIGELKPLEFCYGAAWTRFAKVKDVIESLNLFSKENSISTIYLAADPSLVDSWVYGNLTALPGITVVSAANISDWQNKVDPYYFSIIEQEICAKAEVFIGSFSSSWTEFIFQVSPFSPSSPYPLLLCSLSLFPFFFLPPDLLLFLYFISDLSFLLSLILSAFSSLLSPLFSLLSSLFCISSASFSPHYHHLSHHLFLFP